MNMFERLGKFEPYTPAEYHDEIRLDANESCFDLPQEIKGEIAEKIAKAAFNRYPDPSATKLCEKYAEFIGVKPENVVAGNGSDELLTIILGAMLKPNSLVMLVSPDFSMYKIYSEIYGQNTMVYTKPEDFKCEKAVSLAKKADLILFSNPCNPTSTGVCAKEIIEATEKLDAIVLADEAYMDFWDESVIPYIETHKNLMVLKTCSKAVGLAAARVGFAVANKELVDLIKKVKSPYNVSTLDQIAATTVLSHKDYLKKRTSELKELRTKLYNGLKPLLCADMYMPKPATNFVTINTDRAVQIKNDLANKGILVRCLQGNILRISVGTEEETAALLKAFEEVVL